MGEVVGAILTGGRASRMGGRPKDALPGPDGRPLIELAHDALAPLCDRVVMLGDSDLLPDLDRLADVVPDRGPLGGIAALVEGAGDATCMVVACDQPRLTSALLQRLLDAPGPAASFVTDDRRHPLPLRLDAASARPIVHARLDGASRSLIGLLEALDAAAVDLPEHEIPRIGSINTPEDYETLL